MLDVEKIKTFLRIDTDAEDELLSSFAQAADEFVINSCGDGAAKLLDTPRVELIQQMLIADWYENRCINGNKGGFARSIESMLMQLRLEVGE